MPPTPARDLDNAFFCNKAASELRAEDPAKVYDDMRMKVLWGCDLKVSNKAHDAQINEELRSGGGNSIAVREESVGALTEVLSLHHTSLPHRDGVSHAG